MSSRVVLTTLAFVSTLATPQAAFAASSGASSSPIPEWLSFVVGAVGLAIAAWLLADAVLLRRVAEGSIIANNIGYMVLAVVCLGLSMVLRWFGLFAEETDIASIMTFGADLLITAGMALLAVYFLRVRMAMSKYIAAASAAYPGAEGASEEASGDDDRG